MEMLIHESIIDGAVGKIRLSEPEIYVDNEKRGRSGHMGHAMASLGNGKIIAFNSNTSAKRVHGHSVFGWMEYRISEDYGKSWGDIQKLDYSFDLLLNGIYTACVEKCVACNDGSIVAFCTMCAMEGCGDKYGVPTVIRSSDEGKSWSEAVELSEFKGRIYDAFYHEGDIYVLQFCGERFFADEDKDYYRIFKSEDNGKSFYELSKVGFESMKCKAYGNMILTSDERIIVYAYNDNDEFNMDCVISEDMGKTWGKTFKSHVAKKIRNPQVNILDGQFILHGRAGEYSDSGKSDVYTSSGAFVFYTSRDGINWDGGKILVEGRAACFYSNNLVVKCPDEKDRMLVQYSENCKHSSELLWSGQVNVMHMWVESVN